MDKSDGGASKCETVDEYIESQPAKARKAFITLRECIHRAVPGVGELINYNIPAFTLVPGGKRDEQVMIAGYAHHVGFYPHPL